MRKGIWQRARNQKKLYKDDNYNSKLSEAENILIIKSPENYNKNNIKNNIYKTKEIPTLNLLNILNDGNYNEMFALLDNEQAVVNLKKANDKRIGNLW